MIWVNYCGEWLRLFLYRSTNVSCTFISLGGGMQIQITLVLFFKISDAMNLFFQNATDKKISPQHLNSTKFWAKFCSLWKNSPMKRSIKHTSLTERKFLIFVNYISTPMLYVRWEPIHTITKRGTIQNNVIKTKQYRFKIAKKKQKRKNKREALHGNTIWFSNAIGSRFYTHLSNDRKIA